MTTDFVKEQPKGSSTLGVLKRVLYMFLIMQNNKNKKKNDSTDFTFKAFSVLVLETALKIFDGKVSHCTMC